MCRRVGSEFHRFYIEFRPYGGCRRLRLIGARDARLTTCRARRGDPNLMERQRHGAFLLSYVSQAMAEHTGTTSRMHRLVISPSLWAGWGITLATSRVVLTFRRR